MFALSVDLTRSGVVWLTTAGADCGGCVSCGAVRPTTTRGSRCARWAATIGPVRSGWPTAAPTASSAERVSGSRTTAATAGTPSRVSRSRRMPRCRPRSPARTPGPWYGVPVSSPVLWRASLDGTDWREVPSPAPLDPDAAPVAIGDALLLWVAGDPGPEAVVTRDGGRTWQPLDPPCARGGGQVGTMAAYATCLLPSGAGGGRLRGRRLGDLAAGRRAGSGREPVAPGRRQQLCHRRPAGPATSSSAAGCWSAAIAADSGTRSSDAAHGVAGSTTRGDEH